MLKEIESAVEEKLKEEEWQDCFLIDVVGSSSKVQVFIDSDEAITFDRCRKMSRYLEEILDEKNFSGGKYVLEVSSPGIDRPLKMHRQFLKNVGRRLKLHLKEGKVVKGELLEAQPDQLKMQVPDPEDKKKKRTIEKWFSLNEIDKALVQISFK